MEVPDARGHVTWELRVSESFLNLSQTKDVRELS